MIYFTLFYEFAKIGLFNFGGGMAAIPFLQDLGLRTGWYTLRQMTDFIAISESTPGPMAVNMATFAGYTTRGVLGGIVATLGLISPALVLVSIMAKFFTVFKDNKYVERAFYGLRPCVLALISYALVGLVQVTMFFENRGVYNLMSAINFKAVLIFVVIFALLNEKHLKKMHPVFFLRLSAVIGIVVY